MANFIITHTGSLNITNAVNSDKITHIEKFDRGCVVYFPTRGERLAVNEDFDVVLNRISPYNTGYITVNTGNNNTIIAININMISRVEKFDKGCMVYFFETNEKIRVNMDFEDFIREIVPYNAKNLLKNV